MIIKLLSFLYKKVKKTDLNLNTNLSLYSVVEYFFKKGFFPFLRGSLRTCINSNIRSPFFLGQRVNFYSINKLSTGAGCYIGHSSHIDCTSINGLNLGDRVTIREYAWFQITSHLNDPGDGIFIDDSTYIGPYAKIGAAGKVEIGKKCQIGPSLTIIAEEHLFSNDSAIFDQGVSRSGVMIGNDCWFGAGVTILDGVTIGNGVVIGANSLVIRDIPSYSVAVGSPARVIKSRNENN